MKRLLISAVLGACMAAPAFAADIVLKAGHDNTVSMPYHLGMVKFKEAVESRTNGKVEVKIYPNAQLGNEMEMIKQILTGSLDMCVTSSSKLVNFIPEIKIFTMPFLFDTPDHLDAAMRSPEVDGVLSSVAGSKGFRVVGAFSAGVRHVLNSKKPLFSMADLKGLKIRVMGNPVHVAAFRAFGANPSPIAYNELYGALQTNVVDGAEAANTNYYGKKFYEVAGYWAQVGWLNIMAPVIMSEKKLKSLPADVQKIVIQAGIEAAEYQRALYIQADKENFGKLLAEGVKVTYMDPTPFREASKQVYDEFLKTDQEKKLLAAIKAAK
ncbi:MAG: TRAP transporter substrate-binding protein [Rhodospirillales bacterium]|jgi:TRAP-type transport system periplasmic protein|nr:TRAP transporter substrate-binding protein [Rhodospirillales bacterium]